MQECGSLGGHQGARPASRCGGDKGAGGSPPHLGAVHHVIEHEAPPGEVGERLQLLARKAVKVLLDAVGQVAAQRPHVGKGKDAAERRRLGLRYDAGAIPEGGVTTE